METLKQLFIDLYPPGWSEHYNEVRMYVAEKLQEKYPERNLLNFHFTPGEDFMNCSKEQMWEELQKCFVSIDRGEYRDLDFKDSNRPDYKEEER